MKYKAFMSYSHAADGKLAPAVQSALHHFARPWYKLRAIRVFRDKTSLSATPALWPSIESALIDSEYFLLLASPEAARSPWVEREVMWWLSNRAADSMLILLTDGKLVWNKETKDYDWQQTNALGPYLESQLENEPLFVDLRQAKSDDTLSLRHSQFRSTILDIAAPLHGKDKDQLDGEDVREHRRTKMIATAAFMVILGLGIAAEWQREVAVDERDTAKEFASRLQVVNALDLYENNDQLGALVWLSEVLKRDHDNPQRVELHRKRVGAFFRQIPQLSHIWSHKSSVNYAAFSPDGLAVVTASGRAYQERNMRLPAEEGEVRVWNAVNGKPLSPVLLHEAPVYSAAFSADGRQVVTASGDRTARFWDIKTGKPSGPVLEHNSTVRRVVFSPNGRQIATLSAGSVRVWDSTTGEPVSPEIYDTSDYNTFWHLAFSRDGKRILTTIGSVSDEMNDRGAVKVWDAKTGDPITPLMHQGGRWVYFADFSADGRYVVSASENGTVMLWDVTSGKSVSDPILHAGPVYHASFSPDGKYMVTASGDGTARVYIADLDSETQQLTFQHSMKHGGEIRHAAFSPDGRRFVTSGTDGMARVWDVETGTIMEPPLPHSHSVYLGETGGIIGTTPGAEYFVTFAPDGRRLITTGWDGTVRLWDLAIQGLITINSTKGSDRDNSPSRGRILKGDLEAVRVIDKANGETEVAVLDHEHTVYNKKLSPDGSRVITFSRWHVEDESSRTGYVKMGETCLWNLDTRDSIVLSTDPEVSSVIFSPDGSLVATVSGKRFIEGFEIEDHGGVKIWNAQTGEAILSLPAPEGGIERIFFSDDAKRFAIAGGYDSNSVRFFETATGKALSEAIRHQCEVTAVRFNPDNRKVLIISTDPTVRVWDVNTAKPVVPPLFPERRPTEKCQKNSTIKARFSADGRWVATAGPDTYAQVWDASTGHAITPRLNHSETGIDVKFSPDSRQLITFRNGTQWVWDLAPDERAIDYLLELAQVLAVRRLDASGSLVPLTSAEFERRWQNVSSSLQRISTKEASIWHRREAARYEARGDWFPAAFHLDRVIEFKRTDREIYLRRAYAYTKRQQIDKAIEDYSQAIEMGVEDWRPLIERANLFITQQKFSEAANDYANVVQRGVDQADILINHALLRLAVEDLDGFSQIAEKLKPRASLTGYGIAIRSASTRVLLLTPKSSVDESQLLDLVMEQFKGRYKNPLLGAALYRAGDYEKARDSFKGFINSNRDLTPAWHGFFLAMSYQQLKDNESARRWLKRAIHWKSQLEKANYNLYGFEKGDFPFLYTSTAWIPQLELYVLEREAKRLIMGRLP
ncbi:MAG: beta-propeller fold lactonase family protein [Gammaproteobacteria bacterium]